MTRKAICFMIFLVMTGLASSAQTTISGKVINSSTTEPAVGVTVTIKGTSKRTKTNGAGEFTINGTKKFPVSLIFSSVEFEEYETQIGVGSKPVFVSLNIAVKPGDEIVVSANRFATKLINAPVSIEQFNTKTILNSPATSFYDIAQTKKGVDITTSGLLFKSISTRGFNESGSTRVNQLTDGMDNQAPGANFSVGNFIGLTELDVDNVEILPGASSALYGPGGMNGTILISSKNPFEYPGLSVQVKQGIMNIDKTQRDKPSAYNEYSLRWAKAFKNKFAFKIGVQYISAKDWLANDSTNYLRNPGKVIAGTRESDPNYDGVNVYGDETSVDIYPFLAGALGPNNPLAEHINVSRTGYAEKDVIDPQTKNFKLSGAFHYKITSNLEAQLMGYWGTGNTVFTGSNRFSLKKLKIGQYKVELKHTNWFLRSYTTQEDAGEAFSSTVTMQIFNEYWKPSYNSSNAMGSWYPQFVGAYLQARTGGADKTTALNLARAAADQGRPAAGSQQFKQIFDQVRKTPIPTGGLFLETSQLWQTDGQYNFAKKIKFVDLIVGGDYKIYFLNSKGTLFIDSTKKITTHETGAYAQVSKDLFKDFLTLSVAGRYDKNEDFKGHLTPRATAVIHLTKENNIRLSYQTAYRFPTNQNKYIRLAAGSAVLIGGLPWIIQYMQLNKYPVYELDAAGTPLATPYSYKTFEPEKVRSFELGYKTIIAKRLLIDLYGYAATYRNFFVGVLLYQPATGKIYSTITNNPEKVKTHGFGIGCDYRLPKNFSVFFNTYTDIITGVSANFKSSYNTPKLRLNTGVANSGFGRNKLFGFAVNMHWQDKFISNGNLAIGPINAYTSVDAQVNYRLPKIRSMIKLGGTNILNHYYKNIYANPEIGGLYYVSFGWNVF